MGISIIQDQPVKFWKYLCVMQFFPWNYQCEVKSLYTRREAEVNALDGYLRGHGSFRQLVNISPDQKIIVYEYLADNLHNVLYTRPQRKLEEEEVKRVTRVVLKGLATMHEKNLAHTGML